MFVAGETAGIYGTVVKGVGVDLGEIHNSTTSNS